MEGDRSPTNWPYPEASPPCVWATMAGYAIDLGSTAWFGQGNRQQDHHGHEDRCDRVFIFQMADLDDDPELLIVH